MQTPNLLYKVGFDGLFITRAPYTTTNLLGFEGGNENRDRRPRFSTPPEGPSECNALKNMFNRYYCIS